MFCQDWVDVARPMIEERMREYEGDQIQFNLLALCKSPLLTMSSELAVNVRTLRAVEENLARLQPDWQAFIEDSKSDSALHGSDQVHILAQEEVDAAQVPQEMQEKLGDPTLTAEQLFGIRHEITNSQNYFHATIIEEMAAIAQDNQRATNRRHDYTPLIYTWLTFLANNGTLCQIVEAIDQS
jgi:ubiquitin carboxyl-terminal hydrolase L5